MSTSEWLTIIGMLAGAGATTVGAYLQLRVKIAECQRDIKNLEATRDDMRVVVMRLLEIEKEDA